MLGAHNTSHRIFNPRGRGLKTGEGGRSEEDANEKEAILLCVDLFGDRLRLFAR